MSTGIVISPHADAENAVDDVVAQARRAHELGVAQVWLAQRVDFDAIAMAALVGAAVPGLKVGTSVVPINPRHPLLVSALAQTAQAASHGNFTLGLGLGSHEPERQAFGTAWPDPVGRLREHLSILRSVFDTGAVDIHGEYLSAAPEWPVAVPGGTPVPVYVAAMGPKALRVTAELADGVLPYLAGPRTVAEFLAPTLAEAAGQAGRPTPSITAMVPVLLTGSSDAALAAGQEKAAAELGFYDSIPSYQRIITREGLSGAAGLAVVGPPERVARQLAGYRDAGATGIVVSPLDRDDRVALEDLWAVAAEV
jgi:F420-dependent oxidoreductase-like protein